MSQPTNQPVSGTATGGTGIGSSVNHNGEGPFGFKWCGGGGVPLFLWPDQQDCPGASTESKSPSPPSVDYTAPLNKLGDAAGKVKDFFGVVTNPSYLKGAALLLGAVILLVLGVVIANKDTAVQVTQAVGG